MGPDVAHIGGTEQGVAYSVNKDICIAMSQKAMGVGDEDATEPQCPVGNKAVDIVAHAYSEVRNHRILFMLFCARNTRM